MNITHHNSLDDLQLWDIAKLNVEAFKRPPMNKALPNLSVEESYIYHKSHVNRDGFICALAYEADKLMGYSWGLCAEALTDDDIDPEKLKVLQNHALAKKYDIHYSGSTCVFEENIGLGSWMISSRINKAEKKYAITQYHADNNPIKIIYRNLYGSPLAIIKNNKIFNDGELAIYSTKKH